MDAHVVDLQAQPTAAVRVQQRMDELDIAGLFDRYPAAIAGRLGELATPPSGPRTRYHAFGPQGADIRSASRPGARRRPRAAGECAPGEIGQSELPAGPAAMTVHTGPYDELGRATRRSTPGSASRGAAPGGAQWESYVDDPTGADPAGVRTEIYWPLES